MESRKSMLSIILPKQFKTIGLSVIVISIISAIFLQPSATAGHQGTVGFILLNSFILGLLLFSLSGEAIGSGQTTSLQVRSILGSALVSVFYAILAPVFISIINKQELRTVSGQELLICMLIMYNIFFFLQKKATR